MYVGSSKWHQILQGPNAILSFRAIVKNYWNLPNKFDIFTPKDYVVYVLDDYSVHLMPEVKEAFSHHYRWWYNRGYTNQQYRYSLST